MTNAAWNGPVTMEDVPEEFRDVAEALGMKAFLKLRSCTNRLKPF